jgi:hypothetical protein
MARRSIVERWDNHRAEEVPAPLATAGARHRRVSSDASPAHASIPASLRLRARGQRVEEQVMASDRDWRLEFATWSKVRW